MYAIRSYYDPRCRALFDGIFLGISITAIYLNGQPADFLPLVAA